MSKHPEIIALNKIYIQYNVEIKVNTEVVLNNKKEYPSVSFILGGKTFEMFVDDEYDDFRYNYPLLNLCLVLRELEYYNDTQDFLQWCTEQYLDASNKQVLDYFKDLARIYREVEAILGEVKSQITGWDFEMGSGPAGELRKKDFSR